MYVRNAIEDFHVAHLSDAQMKELNPLIRNALWEALTMMEPDAVPANARTFFFDFMIASIPDYWELPGTGQDAQEFLDDLARSPRKPIRWAA